jgi:hypothetical protein
MPDGLRRTGLPKTDFLDNPQPVNPCVPSCTFVPWQFIRNLTQKLQNEIFDDLCLERILPPKLSRSYLSTK